MLSTVVLVYNITSRKEGKKTFSISSCLWDFFSCIPPPVKTAASAPLSSNMLRGRADGGSALFITIAFPTERALVAL